ncbi:MAG TPA: dihydropteroate synthase, partial [Myxococcota bacterium]|nr:dihydropteroate synthase [Myxococcota bacterium]
LSAQGLKKDRIILDPGIGFGKGLKDSLTIINNMHCFAHLSALTMIGVSRKSFLGHLLAISDPMLRDGASLGATAAAIATGANIVRTHNVKATYDMVRAFNACRSAKRRDHYEDLH